MTDLLATIMQDDTLRRALGNRIKELRKAKDWTQKELAKQLGTSPAQLNKYESSQNTPQLDRIVLLAELLDTTVDYLLTGNTASDLPIHNTRLIQRLKVIEGFEPQEKEVVIELLDAMIAKHNIQKTAQTLGT
jgi:transcriptional regulator with XRE-family HTH domain